MNNKKAITKGYIDDIFNLYGNFFDEVKRNIEE